MDEAEVKWLAVEGMELLERQSISLVSGTEDPDLLACHAYVNRNGLVPASVVKGIHQRNTKPHITLSLNSKHLHLWLSTSAVGAGTQEGSIYPAVSISASEG